jgi:hypothetical protein
MHRWIWESQLISSQLIDFTGNVEIRTRNKGGIGPVCTEVSAIQTDIDVRLRSKVSDTDEDVPLKDVY